MGQKIPLPKLLGVIHPIAVNVPFVLFEPLDAKSADPSIYEVHLYLLPRNANGSNGVDSSVDARVRAYPTSLGPAAAATIWRGTMKSNSPAIEVSFDPIVKALDGYPVRGSVTLDILAVSADGDSGPIFAWGWYHRVGQGPIVEPERRPIGLDSSLIGGGFNAGVPFAILAAGSEIVHTFETDRIDELSLAVAFASDNLTGNLIALRFEDENNALVVTDAPFRQRNTSIYTTIGAAGSLVSLPPYGSLFPPSPYFLHQVPFGNGLIPALDHLRVTNAGAATAFVHGYFTRR